MKALSSEKLSRQMEQSPRSTSKTKFPWLLEVELSTPSMESDLISLSKVDVSDGLLIVLSPSLLEICTWDVELLAFRMCDDVSHTVGAFILSLRSRDVSVVAPADGGNTF